MNVTVMKVFAVLSVAAILGCASVSKPSITQEKPTAHLEGKSVVQQKPQRQWDAIYQNLFQIRDEDPDYVTLKAANDGLLDSLNAIFVKLEDAYIAYKKFEATPSRSEYGDVMRKVLADGLRDASEAEKHYLQMSRTK